LYLFDKKTGERADNGEIRIVATVGDVPLPQPTKFLPVKIRFVLDLDSDYILIWKHLFDNFFCYI